VPKPALLFGGLSEGAEDMLVSTVLLVKSLLQFFAGSPSLPLLSVLKP